MSDNLTSSSPAAKNPAQVALELFTILQPLPPEVRKRAVQAALASLGDDVGQVLSSTVVPQSPPHLNEEFSDTKLGPKALKWIQRNGISCTQLDEVFHLSSDPIEITASEVPGASKKEMTANCYLLAGVRGLLQFDESKLSENEALALCKRLTAYDKNNHTTFRRNVGNRMSGNKPDFVLTGPGERAAADLIKAMTSPAP